MNAISAKRVRPRQSEKKAAIEAGYQAELAAWANLGRELIRPSIDWVLGGMTGPRPVHRKIDWEALSATARAANRAMVGEELQRLVLVRQLAEIDARRAAEVRRSLTPIAGVGPDPQKLETQALVSGAVHDRARPRSAVLTGDLPRAVRQMVARGWLTPEGAAALARFADDHHQAWCGGVGTQSWAERVEGGAAQRNGGRSAAAVAAGLRFDAARAVLGENNSSLVRSVMIEGVALWEIFDKSSRKHTRAVMVSGQLVAAAGVLVAHYRALSG